MGTCKAKGKTRCSILTRKKTRAIINMRKQKPPRRRKLRRRYVPEEERQLARLEELERHPWWHREKAREALIELVRERNKWLAEAMLGTKENSNES